MKTLEINGLWRNCWRLVLPFECGPMELTARRLAGKETGREKGERLRREAAVWGQPDKIPRTFSFPLGLHPGEWDEWSETIYPLTPRNWETSFYLWRGEHHDDLNALGYYGRGGSFNPREMVNFDGATRFNPEPDSPQAFAVWLEWLEGHEERRFHWERWRAKFAECIEAGARFEAGADESELRALLTALNARYESPETAE
jgi:hypothetical protein